METSAAQGFDLVEAERARQRMQPARAMVESLEELNGPTAGTVSLPLRLDWSESNSYDLSNEVRLRTMYSTVLTVAKDSGDLRDFIDGDLLRRVWADLRLPLSVRSAWQRRHPELTS